ncbi:MAG: recombinase family protein [Nocardioides sp.]|uniref:recombinase family protein n=1 Tax=Nocardioides sp. TaxID=35761 RepID=UPI002383E312|nr:recombinase family protein [Nocardioides sp.]MDE0775930.1 recombinase family protein [Nocardioides sp.]
MTDRAYLCVSFVRQKGGVRDNTSGTIQKQRVFLARHVAADHVEYVDESVSASKIPFGDRPAGRRLLRELQHGDRLLVTRIDRAARNVRDLLDLVELVEERGASIIFTEQQIDTGGPMGKFMLTLLGAIAELEAGIISERRIETLTIMKADGRHAAGGIPVGLRTIPREGGGRVLAVDPETGPKVAAVVEAILAGATVASQAPLLGITASSLSRLLGNRALAEHGVITWTQHDALQLRTPGRKSWTRTGGVGEGLRCYSCGGRLYLSKPNGAKGKPVYKCGPGRHRELPTGGVAISADRLEHELEALFLGTYGPMQVEELRTVGDDEERAQRVHEARTALEAAKAAMDAANGDEAEDVAYAAWRAAKNDLRAAETMPVQTREELVPTGQTYAEAWASADDAERVKLLRFPGGPWVVGPAEWGDQRVVERAPSGR